MTADLYYLGGLMDNSTSYPDHIRLVRGGEVFATVSAAKFMVRIFGAAVRGGAPADALPDVQAILYSGRLPEPGPQSPGYYVEADKGQLAARGLLAYLSHAEADHLSQSDRRFIATTAAWMAEDGFALVPCMAPPLPH